MTQIHPSAVVDSHAQLADDVIIGPFCTVGPNVILGAGTRLISHGVVDGHTTLGANNTVYPFASVGHPPQDLKYKGEPTRLIIGDNNTIRECTTLQPGTIQDLGETRIGHDNLFMAYVHIAHDCVVGNHNVFANGAQLSGHVHIGNNTIIGGLAGIHQFCRVGDLAMVAGGAMTTQDVAPYCIAEGNRAVLRGLNTIGLKRQSMDPSTIGAIKEAYKFIFLDSFPTFQEAKSALLTKLNAKNDALLPAIKTLLEFVENSARGVTRPG